MIPEEAVGATREAVRAAMIEYGPDGHTDGDEEITRAALKAAAPYLMKLAWDEGWAAGWDAARGEPEESNPYEEAKL